MPNGTTKNVICTEGRLAKIEVNGLEVHNSDHEEVKPVAECATCSSQPSCEEYQHAVNPERR